MELEARDGRDDRALARRGRLIGAPSPRSTLAVSDLLRSVAALGLPGHGGSIREVPLPPRAWQELLEGAHRERLVPRLHAATAQGLLAVASDQREEIAAASVADACRVLALEALLLDVVSLLERVQLDVRVLKGSAAARLDHPDPSLRSFVDVDVIVRAHQVDDAVAALTRAGFVRQEPQQVRGYDRRFGKSVTFLSPDGYEVDLHRTFDRGPLGVRLRLEDLWSSSATFALGGRPLLALGTDARFLNACYHAALSDVPARLSSLRDVAEMIYGSVLDPDAAIAVARASRAEIVVAQAVTLAMSELRLTTPCPLGAWAERYRPDPADAELLQLYVDPGQSHGARLRAMLAALPSWRARAGYLRAVLLPSRGYRVSQGRGGLVRRLGRWRQPWRFVAREGETDAGEPSVVEE